MKKGDIEIEYEGDSEEVKSKFSEIFDWLKNTTSSITSEKPNDKPVEGKGSKSSVRDKGMRGGARTSVLPPEIDNMVKNGFFDKFKGVDEVQAELKRNTVSASLNAVKEALKRKVPKVLERIQQDGKWVYRKRQTG
jgi:hypothetical protein